MKYSLTFCILRVLAAAALACISLAACSPSVNSIETAIAQTQAAQPTATPPATATYTPEPSATLEPTATAVPSDTPIPTWTPRATWTPRPALASVILTRTELDELLGGFYSRAPIDISREIFSDGEERRGSLFPADTGAADVIVYLVRWNDAGFASAATSVVFGDETAGGDELEIGLTLNNTARMAYVPADDEVLLMFSSGDVMAYITVAMVPSVDTRGAGAFASLIGLTQLNKLEASGYR